MFKSFSCASFVPRLCACLWVGAGSVLTSVAWAHGSHSHGHGAVRLVVEGSTLTAVFDVPLESLLGYDYPPQGADQERVWSELKTRLQDPLNFLQPAADARCQVVGHEATPDPAAADPNADIPNIVYRAEFRCDRPEALNAVSFTAFRDHPGLKQLRVQLASPKGRKTVTVRPRFPALTF
ncbi:DUF2796 domain-containing protein [Caldimonas sp.]|uniref:ZrgA family zinc uptake protein n=1 Tax=Caldimonas sp. TaxID=2838790 RepID=UPI00391BFB6D